MTARRRRRGTAVQDTPEIGDSKHAGSRKSESHALRSAKPRRSLPLRRARLRGPLLALHGSPSQVIVTGSNIDSVDEEAGAVSLLSLDEAVDEGDEDESIASLPRSGRDSCAAGYMELVFNDSTGLWDWAPFQPKKASRWLIGVEGASRLLW